MATTAAMQGGKGNKLGRAVGVAALLAAGYFGWWYYQGKETTTDRATVYKAAIETGSKQATTWPKTEQELVATFWSAIAQQKLEQAVIYCPGSTASDYKAYSYMAPGKDIKIGKPEPHPHAKGVQLWPFEASFRGYGAKTIKLAVAKLPDGRLAIDGQHSIWW